MRRGFTYAGGKRRQIVYKQTSMVCERCHATVKLEYRTDAVTDREAALDLHRALRHAGWYPMFGASGASVTALCPTHGYEDVYGH